MSALDDATIHEPSVHGTGCGPRLTPGTANPVLDPRIQEALDRLEEREPGRGGELDAARRRLTGLHPSCGDLPGVSVETLTLPVGPLERVRVKLFRPEAHEGEPLPVALLFHGGGWTLGGADSHAAFASRLALGAGTAVMLVEYSLAPEAIHPVQNEEGHAVLCWVGENADRLGLDRGRLAVVGDEAGGAIAAAVTQLACRRDSPDILLQVLVCPVTAAPARSGSYGRFANGPGVTADGMRRAFATQFPNGTPANGIGCAMGEPLVSLRYLPPALVITAEADILCDEGEAYARRLMMAGVDVVATRYLGTVNGFATMQAFSSSAPAQAAIAQICGALSAAFSTGKEVP